MEITREYIFRCFRNELTAREKAALDAWVGESEANARMYREALTEFEYLLVNGNIDTIRDKAPVRRRHRLRIAARVFSGAVAAAAIFLAAFLTADYRTAKDLSEHLLSTTALPGQITTMTLTDGSRVQLNAGATMHYPPLFKGKERMVQLDGEAFFEVSRDEKKPFIVRTFATDIEVLGTKFNVNADEESGEFSVTLAEGSVRVSSLADPDNAIIMRPDEKVYIIDGKLAVTKTRAKDEIRWRDGIIDIGGLDFAALMDRLEMAFGVDIVIDREPLPELCFTDGRLRVSDGIEYALEVLQKGSDFTWSKDYGSGTIYIH